MRSLGLTAGFVLFLVAPTALADVPPPDVCGEVGVACQRAAPDFKTPGICTKSTCSKRNLSTGKDYTYECLRCVASGQKAPPKESSTPATSATPPPAPAPATTTTPTTPAVPPPDEKKSGGCGMSGGTPEYGLSVLFTLGLGLLLLRRGR